MAGLAIKILVGIGMKFMTEAFFSKVIGHGCLALADSAKNKLTKEVATDVATALGVSDKP